MAISITYDDSFSERMHLNEAELIKFGRESESLYFRIECSDGDLNYVATLERNNFLVIGDMSTYGCNSLSAFTSMMIDRQDITTIDDALFELKGWRPDGHWAKFFSLLGWCLARGELYTLSCGAEGLSLTNASREELQEFGLELSRLKFKGSIQVVFGGSGNSIDIDVDASADVFVIDDNIHVGAPTGFADALAEYIALMAPSETLSLMLRVGGLTGTRGSHCELWAGGIRYEVSGITSDVLVAVSKISSDRLVFVNGDRTISGSRAGNNIFISCDETVISLMSGMKIDAVRTVAVHETGLEDGSFLMAIQRLYTSLSSSFERKR